VRKVCVLAKPRVGFFKLCPLNLLIEKCLSKLRRDKA